MTIQEEMLKYYSWDINEIMYYCDEFEFVTVIMHDNKIFRLYNIEDFITFYNQLKMNDKKLEEKIQNQKEERTRI